MRFMALADYPPGSRRRLSTAVAFVYSRNKSHVVYKLSFARR